MSNLDALMIAAHAAGDKTELVALYTEAANLTNDLNTKCFYLTHAYIFALDTGANQTAALHARLVSHGREE
jgi:hypothetical protein